MADRRAQQRARQRRCRELRRAGLRRIHVVVDAELADELETRGLLSDPDTEAAVEETLRMLLRQA